MSIRSATRHRIEYAALRCLSGRQAITGSECGIRIGMRRLPRRGDVPADQAVEEGRLAGAGRADQRDDRGAAHATRLHVDGAYGGLAASQDYLREHYAGLSRANSIALDFHKWLYQPFEIGCTSCATETLSFGRKTMAGIPALAQ